MNKLKRLLWLVPLALSAVSCLLVESEQEDELDVVYSTSPIPGEGGSVKVLILSSAKWKTEIMDTTWGSIEEETYTKGKGGSFVFVVPENTQDKVRKNIITITVGKKTEDVIVTQEACEPFLKQSETGIYGVRNVDIVFRKDGQSQLSTAIKADGSKCLTIIYPSTQTYCRIDGIPSTLKAGDSVKLDVKAYSAGNSIADKQFDCKVIKVEKKKAWLKDSSADVAFII